MPDFGRGNSHLIQSLSSYFLNRKRPLFGHLLQKGIIPFPVLPKTMVVSNDQVGNAHALDQSAQKFSRCLVGKFLVKRDHKQDVQPQRFQHFTFFAVAAQQFQFIRVFVENHAGVRIKRHEGRQALPLFGFAHQGRNNFGMGQMHPIVRTHSEGQGCRLAVFFQVVNDEHGPLGNRFAKMRQNLQAETLGPR